MDINGPTIQVQHPTDNRPPKQCRCFGRRRLSIPRTSRVRRCAAVQRCLFTGPALGPASDPFFARNSGKQLIIGKKNVLEVTEDLMKKMEYTWADDGSDVGNKSRTSSAALCITRMTIQTQTSDK